MILYYTGTGNSRHIAKELSKLIGDEQIVDMGQMIADGKTGLFESEKPFVVVVPTYAWQMPHIVRDFIKETVFRGNKKTYFVLTCGDSIGNAGKYAEKLCIEKNLEYVGCSAVKMPENYIGMFNVPDEGTSNRIVEAAQRSLKKIAEIIKAGEHIKTKNTLIGEIESSVVNHVFYKSFVSAKGFRVEEKCTGCGLCESVCVLHNISLNNGQPVWGENCTHCMACISRCPEQAIEYKKKSVGQRRHYLEG